MTLRFIGLGLYDEKGISLKGLEEARKSRVVYAEFYTSLMPSISLEKLESIVKKPIKILTRGDIEDHPEESILRDAAVTEVALLVPGDPMNATTHVDLYLRAKKMGVKTMVTHAASITSAIPGVTGLQSYKFGRTVTIPLPQSTPPLSPYDHTLENYRRGLHTLMLLDIDVKNNRFLLISEAIKQLLAMEKLRKKNLITPTRFVIGAARIGGPDMEVKAGSISDINHHDFGPPPHTLTLPGVLHFMEKETLKLITLEESGRLEKHKGSC